MANSFSWVVWTPIEYVTFHFRDRCVAASLRYRNRAEITVLMSEQKPYPVWFPCRRKSSPVECEHSLRMRSKICKSQLSNGKWSALNSCLNCKGKGVFDRLYCCHSNRNKHRLIVWCNCYSITKNIVVALIYKLNSQKCKKPSWATLTNPQICIKIIFPILMMGKKGVLGGNVQRWMG